MNDDPEVSPRPEAPEDNVRDVRRPPVAGPHYRNVFIAAGLLVAVIGASLFVSPRAMRKEPEAPAPTLPDRTFLDTPPAPAQPERTAGRRAPWWSGFAGLPPEESETQAEEAPAFPAWEEPPPEPEPPPPPDLRRQAFERALRSSTLKPANRSLSSTSGEPGGSESERLLAAAASVLPSPGALASIPSHASAAAPDGALDLGAFDSEGAGRRDGAGRLHGAGSLSPSEVSFHHAAPLFARRYPAPGPSTLRAGSFIVARLETGIDSDAPGPVTARVLRDVTDSATGQRVLIPAGAQLLGSVQSQLAYGDNRVLVAFERLTFSGATYELPGLDALETGGALGLQDRVNHHVLATLGKAALLAALGAGYEISQPQRTTTDALATGDIVAAQMALEINRVATQLLSRSFDRRPTVKVRPGERFYVYVHRDLIL
jgi:type IV secretion system protein VirB10